MHIKLGVTLIAMFVSFALPGCGSGNPRVYPVKGTVFLEGKPFPGGGSIAFVPVGKVEGKTAGGEIRENGEFVMNTYSTGDGSIPGEFIVLITQEVTTDSRDTIPDGQEMPKGGLRAQSVSDEDRVPAGYGDPKTSPLRATIETKSNELHFELKRTLEAPDGSPPPGVASQDQDDRNDRSAPPFSRHEATPMLAATPSASQIR